MMNRPQYTNQYCSMTLKEGLKEYYNRNWDAAIKNFKLSEKFEKNNGPNLINPSKIYIPRCEHYRDNPPGDEWDGSWALTKK